MDTRKTAWVLAFAGLALAACASDEVPGATDDGLEPEDLDPLAVQGKAEAWDSQNNPAYVASDFLYVVNQLPLQGSGPKPIPGSYWPVYQDNINVKWEGAMSPAEKYARAFGKDVAGVLDGVSEANGVKGHTERKACQTSADCADQNDGSECAASYDGSAKRCIPTWWGICHGWAPYALSEPQAKTPVTRTAPDGTTITFEPGDLEALLSLAYTTVDSKFLSTRCNRADDGAYSITYDNTGRINEAECRSMNPGSWHVLVANLMGLKHQGFVIDQTTNYEVWNQPGWSYKVTNAENGALKEVTKDQAMAILGAGQARSELFPSTTLTAGQQRTGSWTATAAATVTFKTSGTGDADLYVKKGRAVSTSDADCSSTGNTADESCAVDVQPGDVVSWLVLGYSSSSSATLGVLLPGSGPYVYNGDAKRFFYVEMDFTFVVESSPGDAPHDASDYSQTKHYAYVLEADANGKIFGGEWAGDSKKDHPDFAWWPTGTPQSDVAGISYADLKALNAEAAGPAPSSDSETLMKDVALPFTRTSRSRYAALKLPAGYTSVTVRMSGSGDASLYVGPKGQYPIVGSSRNLCAQKTAGTSQETCTFAVSPQGGTYWIRAKAEAAGSVVTVVADKTK